MKGWHSYVDCSLRSEHAWGEEGGCLEIIRSLLHIPGSWLRHWHGLLIGLSQCQQPKQTWGHSGCRRQASYLLVFFCATLHGQLMDLTLAVGLWRVQDTWNGHIVVFFYVSSFFFNCPQKNLSLSQLLSFQLFGPELSMHHRTYQHKGYCCPEELFFSQCSHLQRNKSEFHLRTRLEWERSLRNKLLIEFNPWCR